MDKFTLSIILGIVAGAASLFGSLFVLTKRKISKESLFYFIAAGAGFILAATLLEMLPEAMKITPNAMLYIILGFFLIHFFEHIISSHFHFGEETHKEEIHKSTAWSILLALTIHTFLDGVSISAGFNINLLLGITIFSAVILHKIPDGFTIASVMLASGREKKGALAASLVISFSTIAGSFWAATFTNYTPILLAVSAGAFLHIATTDLIPEIVKQKKTTYSLAIFGGVLLYYLTKLLLNSVVI